MVSTAVLNFLALGPWGTLLDPSKGGKKKTGSVIELSRPVWRFGKRKGVGYRSPERHEILRRIRRGLRTFSSPEIENEDGST